MSREMLSALYMGQGNIEVRKAPVPNTGAENVFIPNIYSSVCGTDVAVYVKGAGYRITIGGESGHKTISRAVNIAIIFDI